MHFTAAFWTERSSGLLARHFAPKDICVRAKAGSECGASQETPRAGWSLFAVRFADVGLLAKERRFHRESQATGARLSSGKALASFTQETKSSPSPARSATHGPTPRRFLVDGFYPRRIGIRSALQVPDHRRSILEGGAVDSCRSFDSRASCSRDSGEVASSGAHRNGSSSTTVQSFAASPWLCGRCSTT